MKFRFTLLYVAFFVSFLLAITLSIISFQRFAQLNSRVARVEHSYKVASLINVLNENVNLLDKASFRYILSGEDSFRQQFFLNFRKAQIITDSLKRLTIDNANQQRHLVLFRSDIVLYLNHSLRYFNDSPAMESNLDIPQLLRDRNEYLNAALHRLLLMSGEETRLLKKRDAERIISVQLTGDLIKALSIVFGIITILLFILLVREFRRRLITQSQLQQKVSELGHSKRELEYIAYATSHDLQEPLRKIQILLDRWRLKQGGKIDETTEDTLSRVIAAAAKMQELVSGLMVLSSINDDQPPALCDLHYLVQKAVADNQVLIDAQNATLKVGDLPTINGHSEQLSILFKNLIENALRFSRSNERCIINISAYRTDGAESGTDLPKHRKFHCISIEDNGIGFDNKMTEKMFGIFRKLHTEKEGYAGRGIGLATCQRIVSNHGGYITAHGCVNSGATFKIYLPAES